MLKKDCAINEEIIIKKILNRGKIKRNPLNGDNIYDSRNYILNKNYSDDMIMDRYIKSKYSKYNLIPNYYNQFHALSKRFIDNNDKKIKLPNKLIENFDKHKNDNINFFKKKNIRDNLFPKFIILFIIFLLIIF